MPEISYDQFIALDIRVATVLTADIVENADKLLKLTLDVGEVASGGLGQRTVVSGIRAWYAPEELIGTQVVYLANLAPRMLRGIESQGMILAAGEEIPALLQPTKVLPNGAKVR